MIKFDEAQYLEWDSDFFDYSVAKIIPTSLTPKRLDDILCMLNNEGVRLVYWAAGMDFCSKKAALSKGGMHVDRKTTFVMDAKDVDHGGTPQFNDEIVITKLPQGVMTKELESLAVQCGYYSRFNVDPFIDDGKGDSLYVEWMKNSAERKIADMVLIALNAQSKIVGMITMGNKDGKGDIGLVSVDSSARGKMVGKRLVYAAQTWLVEHGYEELQVVTQGNNVPACRLYQGCNYRIGDVKDFYHFWLGE